MTSAHSSRTLETRKTSKNPHTGAGRYPEVVDFVESNTLDPGLRRRDGAFFNTLPKPKLSLQQWRRQLGKRLQHRPTIMLAGARGNAEIRNFRIPPCIFPLPHNGKSPHTRCGLFIVGKCFRLCAYVPGLVPANPSLQGPAHWVRAQYRRHRQYWWW